MVQFAGWTKMDEGSWRHDASGYGQNKLNIYADHGSSKEHVSNDRGGLGRPDSYDLTYTYNDDRSGSYVVSSHGTLREARKAATRFQRSWDHRAPDVSEIK